MSAVCIFTNARLVLSSDVVHGTLAIAGERIAVVAGGRSAAPRAIDCEGDYLLPGLVELHTDNLEKHFSPRPGVSWPGFAAVVAHDAQIAASGITTAFDAVAVGETALGDDRLANLETMVHSIDAAQSRGVLRAEHRLHLRCEISHAATPELFRRLADQPLVRLVSIMDHTPGQRQFTTVEKYRCYYQKKHGLSEAEFREFVARQMHAHERYSAPNRAAIVGLSRERGFVLASHDDATAAHVEEAVADGAAIAEFPTTFEAAELSRERGLVILMGAPNLVRGGSHSGNVSAGALASRGLLDILSSDYVPSSLLQGAFQLAGGDEDALPQAVALVSRNPARAMGLDDRGEIAPDNRADLVRVRVVDGVPVVRAVWRAGRRVL